jgi:hypothetical protein
MKKETPILAIIFAAIVSCNNSTQQQSEPEQNQCSTLKMWGIKGNVKRVVTYNYFLEDNQSDTGSIFLDISIYNEEGNLVHVYDSVYSKMNTDSYGTEITHEYKNNRYSGYKMYEKGKLVNICSVKWNGDFEFITNTTAVDNESSFEVKKTLNKDCRIVKSETTNHYKAGTNSFETTVEYFYNDKGEEDHTVHTNRASGTKTVYTTKITSKDAIGNITESIQANANTHKINMITKCSYEYY